MTFLVVGSGGREHALCWLLSQEAEVACAPGNPGIAQVCKCLPADLNDFDSVVEAARKVQADVVVIGPEDPLIGGLADQLREAGFDVFGPGKEAAQVEGSKAFAKQLMLEAGVPTAEARVFDDSDEAKTYAKNRFLLKHPVVVKASGAAQGKGVFVPQTGDEAAQAIHRIMVEKRFGSAGEQVVIEDRLEGREFSMMSLISGDSVFTLPIAQDYKRARDGDEGPNTGGMGTYAPAELPTGMVMDCEKHVVRELLRVLKERGIDFRGVLFTGMMLTENGPMCLEYNVRFGDPEIQSVARLISHGFAEAVKDVARGDTISPPSERSGCAVSVVVASGGYPGNYEKGEPITVGDLPDGVVAFHAGTAEDGDGLVTAGGRVMALSAVGSTLEEARKLAYKGVDQVKFEGMQYRSDIAAS